MSTSNLSFSAQIEDWVRKVKGLETAVFRQSVEDVVEAAQLRIPVDTGFARASIRASTESMPAISPGASGKEGGAYGYDAAQINLVIAGAEIGEVIYIGWTAAYSLALEYGHSKQAPSGFVRLAAQQWPSIVARNVEQVQHLRG